MKPVSLILSAILLFAISSAQAEPYGPTLNEVVQQYAVTRNFGNLNFYLSQESIGIRLGMTARDVERWASKSRHYKLVSRKGSVWKFRLRDDEDNIFALSFEVWLSKGEVIVLKTNLVNEFEWSQGELAQLKALKAVRTNECWVKRNFVDPDSLENGFDFVLETELRIPAQGVEECAGPSSQAAVVMGRPATLYPKHIKK